MGKKKGGRCIALVLVLMLAVCGIALAEQTGTTLWHSHSYTDTKDAGWTDKYSEYQEKQSMPIGLGLDIKLYEFEGVLNQYGLDSINTEYKWDMANNNQSIYGVVHVNAWKAINDLIK